MLPTARSANLTVQELPDETLIFDHQNHKAHCLNRTTALVWKLCDGRTSLAAIAQRVGGAAIAELALEQLAGRDLLTEKIPRASAEKRRSRREVLKKLAVAASLPVIMTVVAPRAVQAVSLTCKTNSDCSSLNFPGGCTTANCVSGKCTFVAQAMCTNCTLASGGPGLCNNGICVQNAPC
jgi:hypothetical protein